MDSTEVSSSKRKTFNLWRETVKFFNTRVNQETTRQEFFGRVGGWPARSLDPRDLYKGLLKSAGYVKSVGRGKYYIIKPIPDVSVTLMREFVFRETPIAWFKFSAGLETFLEARRNNAKIKRHNKNHGEYTNV